MQEFNRGSLFPLILSGVLANEGIDWEYLKSIAPWKTQSEKLKEALYNLLPQMLKLQFLK